MPTNPVPDGYHTVTPFLIVDGAGRLIDFLQQAFGATERLRMPTPDGKVAHAELQIGDSVVMLSDGSPEYPPIQTFIHLYVDDTDATYHRALQAGATTVEAPKDQFYGDRSANIKDPLGNGWSIATHIEDVSEEEMMRRMAALGPQ